MSVYIHGEMEVFLDASSHGYDDYISVSDRAYHNSVGHHLHASKNVEVSNLALYARLALESCGVVLGTDMFDDLHDCKLFEMTTNLKITGTWSHNE